MSSIFIRDTDYIVSDVKVKSYTPNFTTKSINGKVNAKSRGIHQLEFSWKIHLVDEKDIRKFNALMLKIRGQLNPFTLSLIDNTDGAGYCNPLVTDKNIKLTHEADVGSNHIQVSTVGIIEAGTMFQLPNDTKVYTILDELRSTGSVEIFPAIRVSHPANTTLKTSVEPLLRLSEDVYEVSYGKAVEVSFKAMEEL
ncbi:TPA: hypothetical protein ACPVXB_001020 [Vibrio parahaemolyticus]